MKYPNGNGFRENLPSDINELEDIIVMQRTELQIARKTIKWNELNRTLATSDKYIEADLKC